MPFSDDWQDTISFHDMPHVICGPYHYQPDVGAPFDASLSRYGNLNIARVHLKKRAVEAMAA